MYKSLKNISARHRRRIRQKLSNSVPDDDTILRPDLRDRVPTAASTSEIQQGNLTPTSDRVQPFEVTALLNPFDSPDSLASSSWDSTSVPLVPSKLISQVEVDHDSTATYFCSCDECTNPNFVDKQSMIEDLRSWAVKFSVPLNHVTHLLKILHKHRINVPVDARTLLKTPRSVEVSKVAPGTYSHMGIESQITRILDILPEGTQQLPKEIKLNINIDGTVISRSSGSDFWPIIGWFPQGTFPNFNPEPFVIGIYHGRVKPSSANDFLKQFVEEFITLEKNGLKFRNEPIKLVFNALVCDAPAKSFVTYTKSHNGYHGCPKCIQEGEYISNRMTFPETHSQLRSDDSFRNKIHEDHHTGTSILESLNIGMVTQVPIDYMHLVCLGVVKRLLAFWHKGRQDVRIPAGNFDALSDLFLSYKKCVTSDFCRLPRILSEVDRFKATEFRQILLYTGIVALKNFLPQHIYRHFLHLSCAIRILVTPKICVKLNNQAHNLLQTFIEEYSEIYGREYITYNVHNLCHLSKDVLEYGCLDNFSAFPPEAYMFHLKSKICERSAKPLQQIVKRLQESTIKYKLKCRKPYLIEKKYHTDLKIKDDLFSNKEPNNYCLLKNGKYVKINEIHNSNDNIIIRGQCFNSVGGFFSDPMDSRILGIHLCSLGGEDIVFSVTDIVCKVMVLPDQNLYVVLPICHHSEDYFNI
ncbi:unnamed protein product [Phaedon cochleariae]|uniref:Transposase domain-containing protein n=1 Tax=Phaedon cochleariae TaxID=80249 RepID=A0A9N9WZU1_PHACE|nr:unnamed protein product [Phaedon cochleariae]